MAYVNPLVLDNGLTWLAGQVQAVHITGDPSTVYATIMATALARKTSGLVVTGPVDGASVNGRLIRIAAFSQPAGMIAAGTGRYLHAVNTTNSRLLWSQEIDPYIITTVGGTLTLESPVEFEMPGVSD